MLRIAILDDNYGIGIQLKDELKSIDNTIETDAFTSWKDMRDYLCRQPHVNAVMMDLRFEDHTCDGVFYAEEIIKLHPRIKIIYITGYPMDYIQKVFLSKSVQPAGFIIKPFCRNVLEKHIAKLTSAS